jgi:hypothetical protein
VGGKECAADPVPDLRHIEVDRIFESEPIGRSRPVEYGVGMPNDMLGPFGDEIGYPKIEDGAAPARKFVRLGRFPRRKRAPGEDMVTIDGGGRSGLLRRA